MRTIIAIDTETTGLAHVGRPPRPDGIVQVGIAWREDGTVRRWSSLANPGEHFLANGRADTALRVNNLTIEQILAAPKAEEVAAELVAQLTAIAGRTGAPIELRAFNNGFDKPLLAAPPWSQPDDAWGPCIMLAAQMHLNGPHGKWPKLRESIDRLGLSWPDGPEHDAGVDAHAALLVDEELRLRAGAQ